MSDAGRAPSPRSSTAGRSPSTRPAPRWARSWTARRRRRSWPRCSSRSGCAARRSRSWPGFATAMRERVLRVDAPEGAIDVVGTGGDASGTFNISTTAALVVAAAGRPGRQARQPGDHVAVRLGRRPRRARRPDRPRRRVGRRGSPRHRLRVHVRARLPPGDEARRADPPRDRRPDRVQPHRPAHEPGRATAPAPRRRRPRRRASGSRPSPALLGTERTFVVHGDGRRRAAARRHRRHLRRDAGRDRAADGRRGVARPRQGPDVAAAGRDAGRERDDHRGGPPRRARRPARRRAAQRRRGAPRRAARRVARGGDRPGGADDRRRPRHGAARAAARGAAGGGSRQAAGAAGQAEGAPA